jgi:endonuclease/exonuclease/phosphatase family metal-dependent hydrolase
MKIVTFNIRFNNPNDGEFSFEHRKEEIIRRIKEEQPDVIGFQEMRDDMQPFMEENLPNYAWVGHGRTANLDGEHIPMVYRKDKFKMRAFECFWISDTPNVPGSKFEVQGYHPRICNVLTLYSMEDKKSIRVMNIHLDNATADARKAGLQLVVDRSLAYNEIEKLPTFILGDFNAEPGWEEMEPIEKCEDYKDVTGHFPFTYHGFFKEPTEKIDYIYVNDMVNVISCDTWESEEGRICLSDHYPIGLVCEI